MSKGQGTKINGWLMVIAAQGFDGTAGAGVMLAAAVVIIIGILQDWMGDA